MHRKNESRPLDLGPFTRQPSDHIGTVQGLPSGVQPSAYQNSQGQENRDTSSLETPRRSGPSVGGDTRRRSRFAIGSRDIDIPVDRRSGKSKVKTPVNAEPSIWEDRCQKSVESQDIRHREIRVLEAVRIGTSQVSKSRRNQDCPSEEDAWQQSASSKKVPTGSC